MPKIIKCHGSKGGKFKQLVKGGDDIRQDAIMQQVFSTVNDLLSIRSSLQTNVDGNCSDWSKRSTVNRQLKLVTYGIVPLSPACGVLEWVESTLPFGAYLSDKGKTIGAHSRYYPGEWGHRQCLDKLAKPETGKKDDPNWKREAYDQICMNFSPAFRFFFVECFSHSLEAWHDAKTRYTRSCAVNSIVGHILGIGDRHTHNILIHEGTGEVVHIDFGIVFEQGKVRLELISLLIESTLMILKFSHYECLLEIV